MDLSALSPLPPNYYYYYYYYFFFFIMRASISWHNPIGNLKHDIVQVGSAWATALIKTSIPACESNFPSHPCSFFHTFCFMLSKLSFFFLPIKDGNPKYFSYCWTIGTPRAYLIDSCISWEVDLLKKRVVFSRFIYCSDALSYVSNISNNFWQS